MASEPIPDARGSLSKPDKSLQAVAQNIAASAPRKSGRDIRNSPTGISAKHRATTTIVISRYRSDNAERIDIAHFVDIDGAGWRGQYDGVSMPQWLTQ